MRPLHLDAYTDNYVPPSVLPKFPRFISKWLGGAPAMKDVPEALHYVDILIGSFVSLLTIEGVFRHSTVFQEHHAPHIIASYGATAILAFNVHVAPLAQPRNIFVGNFISALIGVCVMKLFSLSETGRDHYWVGGPLAVGVASVAMSALNCVHPPSGASALLPFIDDQIRAMSWWYLPAHIVSSLLIIGVACVTNNILRSYPVYWWTAHHFRDEKPDNAGTKSSDLEIGDNKAGDLSIVERDLVIPQGTVLTTAQMQFLESLKDMIID
ncbi:HPP family protein [Cyberlindnera jadinii NRRL Y-1542]|uniref:HPP-domain-containing protein n=1 Tax=Cyberlindnera jadinii (strain ATCC 18201 / CBS 1600 / BCRC 20928 / JCM 3617 / NBRC 0987 / NRRL Y-1542) TaxID=983966 RepID=A0A1E4S9V6_CYBJN|nr:HPP-domain-containing protein [Cyberlindnera jadinii NRRL Y-1542]ODV76248.1 HPP-domain-containing protein [Cyberlindnera jadinii NRRL Y-1542]